MQIWGFHASNFEAVESLSSTHVDCRNQQASEVFHGNIPLNCEILRTLDTDIFYHILINWMVVLPCCVDPQLTTSHVRWGPPLHFIFAIVLAFFKLLSYFLVPISRTRHGWTTTPLAFWQEKSVSMKSEPCVSRRRSESFTMSPGHWGGQHRTVQILKP